jgi:hypothetical protein
VRKRKGRAKPKTVSVGIRRRRETFEVSVRVGGKQIYTSFPLDATISEMQAWRREHGGTAIGQPSRIIRRRRIGAIPSPLEEFTHVYFIGDDRDRVKIGVAADPLSRLRQLQTSSPVRLVLLAADRAYLEAERALHRRFAASRLSGEWFTRTPELDALIDAVASGATTVNAEYLAGIYQRTLAPSMAPAATHSERATSDGVTYVRLPGASATPTEVINESGPELSPDPVRS